MRPPLSLLALVFACRPPEPPPEDTATDTGAEQGQAPLQLKVDRVALVEIQPPTPDPALPHGAELAGLVAAQLELGLADIDGVVPQVTGAPPAPGLAEALLDDAERWTASASLVDQGDHLLIRLSLCAYESCSDLSSTRGTREEPAAGVAELVEAVADRMLRGEAPGSDVERALPTSADPYAVLLTGRSAATFYGLLPAPPPERQGDRRRDPVARALLVDPETAVGNWIAGRRALAQADAGAARAFFTRAAFNRPTSGALAADEASALLAGGHAEAAWYALQQLDAAHPQDHRFTLLRARAALAAGQPGAALDALDALPDELRQRLAPVTLTVSALEALGQQAAPRYDEALAQWASLAPSDPEPVRRRVRIRVQAGAYADALPQLEDLARRGARDEAARLEMSLLGALGRPSEAAARATALGESALAARIQARAADPAERAALLAADPSPEAQAARAAALLAAGSTEDALRLADELLREHPWDPEALGIKGEALQTLGRHGDALKVRQRLCFADPRDDRCLSNI